MDSCVCRFVLLLTPSIPLCPDDGSYLITDTTLYMVSLSWFLGSASICTSHSGQNAPSAPPAFPVGIVTGSPVLLCPLGHVKWQTVSVAPASVLPPSCLPGYSDISIFLCPSAPAFQICVLHRESFV